MPNGLHSANHLARIRTAIYSRLASSKKKHKHAQLAPARLREDEETVQSLITCIQEFEKRS